MLVYENNTRLDKYIGDNIAILEIICKADVHIRLRRAHNVYRSFVELL